MNVLHSLKVASQVAALKGYFLKQRDAGFPSTNWKIVFSDSSEKISESNGPHDAFIRPASEWGQLRLWPNSWAMTIGSKPSTHPYPACLSHIFPTYAMPDVAVESK